MNNEIPVMDDPLSRHWRQPKTIRSAPMDDTHVILTSDQIGQLSTYSSTRPTGVYPGKCWLREEARRRLLLVWYGDEEERGVPILFREVLQVD